MVKSVNLTPPEMCYNEWFNNIHYNHINNQQRKIHTLMEKVTGRLQFLKKINLKYFFFDLVLNCDLLGPESIIYSESMTLIFYRPLF